MLMIDRFRHGWCPPLRSRFMSCSGFSSFHIDHASGPGLNVGFHHLDPRRDSLDFPHEQAMHPSSYRKTPRSQRITSSVNGTPSSQRMNAFPML